MNAPRAAAGRIDGGAEGAERGRAPACTEVGGCLCMAVRRARVVYGAMPPVPGSRSGLRSHSQPPSR
ncbi:hypothetical protein FGB62_41g25 [Gracilaria domingensis]|nr:hypothetical protein FGB62_41g25 [Gracilaria domingensis]